MPATVVILGASGYVAQRLIRELMRHGHRTVALARDQSRMRFYTATRAEVMLPDDLVSLRAEEPVLINLSYPQQIPILKLREENARQIAGWLDLVAAIGARRMIHISSQAVFGYVWKRQPGTGSAPLRFDDTYVDLKLQAERTLYRRWRRAGGGYELAIVRFGNVIGGGAVPYGVTIAQRIMEGRPVAAHNGDGVLNGTHVDNIAAYLRALVEIERLPDDPGVFHHLAEFGDRRWKDLAEPIARAIGVEPVYLASVPSEPSLFSTRRLMPHISAVVRRLGWVIRRVPRLPQALERLKPTDAFEAWSGSDPNRGWFLITAGAIEFPPSVLPGWQPPLSWDQAVAEIVGWLGAAGYILKAPGDQGFARGP